MASHKSVVHAERGFRMSRAYAEQVMREHCSITWQVNGVSVRDTTTEERISMLAEQAKLVADSEVLVRPELSGTKFERPKTTRYIPPSREEYEHLDSPLCFAACKWPRKSQEWPSRSHVDQVIAQMEALS